MGACMQTEQRHRRAGKNGCPTAQVTRRPMQQQKNTYNSLQTTQTNTPCMMRDFKEINANSTSTNELSSTPEKDVKCNWNGKGQSARRSSRQSKENNNRIEKQHKSSASRTTRNGFNGYQQDFPSQLKNSNGQKNALAQSIDPHQQNFYRQQQKQTTVFTKKRINSASSPSGYTPNSQAVNEKKTPKMQSEIVDPLSHSANVVRISRKKSRQMLELMSEESELQATAFDQEGDSRIYVKGTASNISFLVPRDRAGPLVVSKIDYQLYAI